MQILKTLIAGKKEDAINIANSFGWINTEDGKLVRNRERIEFEEKLETLGILKPWE